MPAEEVPPELPEPALGINFARDGMEESDWLALVAVHSDAWLLAVAFYFGARFGFNKESRYYFPLSHCYIIKNFFHLADICYNFLFNFYTFDINLLAVKELYNYVTQSMRSKFF